MSAASDEPVPRHSPIETAAGTSNPGELGTTPKLWAWAVNTAAFSASQHKQLAIGEGNFSGAARLYAYLLYTYFTAYDRWPGQQAGPLGVWAAPGISWSCGACFGQWPTSAFGVNFTSQIWMPGNADMGYYSDSVTAHELGHWAMSTFGRSPGEGGMHCVGVLGDVLDE